MSLSKTKRILKIFFVAVITAVLGYSAYGIFASAEGYSFEYPSLGLYPVKAMYHTEMNEYFNNKIDLFLDMDSSDKNYSIPETGEECGEDNVSTYCVAMGATQMYYAYIKTLDQIVPTVSEIKSKNGAPVVGNVLAPIADVFTAVSKTDGKVNQEKKDALKIMDMTISAYNEFRLAYPVHLKYQEITKELYTYVKNLRKLRMVLSSFPAKFIDATSQSCK